MTTVRRGAGFPVVAIALGTLGAVAVAFGLMGLFAPDALPAPARVLQERTVAGALVVSGALFMAIEALLVVAWARRRRAQEHRGSGRT